MKVRRGAPALLLCLLWLAVAAPAAAQEPPAPAAEELGRAAAEGAARPEITSSGLDEPRNEFGVWGGGSFDSPTLWGSTDDARFGILALRYSRVLARGKQLAFSYTVDAVPAAVLSFPELTAVVPPGGGQPVFERRRRSVYGAGLTPIGFRLDFRRRETVRPFVQTTGGFLYFADPVPNKAGRQFNFTADFGAGVRWRRGDRAVWTFGYRYHHISNWYRGLVNPGFDSNLFYLGYSVIK